MCDVKGILKLYLAKIQTNECTLSFTLFQFINFLLYHHPFQNNSAYQLYPLLYIHIRMGKTRFYSNNHNKHLSILLIFEAFPAFIGNMNVNYLKNERLRNNTYIY